MSKALEKVAVSLWGIAVFACCFIVVVSLLPFSPLRSSISFIEKEKLTAVVPQGWGFFTKDPQEDRINFYKLNSDGKWETNDVANASAENYFGASRKSRLRGLELSNIIERSAGNSTGDWKSCSTHDQELCLDSLAEEQAIEIDNEYPIRTICGTTALMRQKPNPWAYSQAGFENGNEVKYLFMKVNCE